MQFSKKATSLVEAIVIMTIVTFGIIGAYDFFISSEKLADNTSRRIKAIQIAREGIEALTNIRNTNWLLYGADYKNCWNTLDYDINCIGSSHQLYDIKAASYIVYQDSSDRWLLAEKNSGVFADTIYKKDFGIEIGSHGFYKQDPGGISGARLTREIMISYPEDTNGDSLLNSNDEKMLVTSFVQWENNGVHKVTLSHMLSNWKN